MDQLPRQIFTQEYSLHQIDCTKKSRLLKILSSYRGQGAELPSYWGQAFKLRPILLSLSSAVGSVVAVSSRQQEACGSCGLWGPRAQSSRSKMDGSSNPPPPPFQTERVRPMKATQPMCHKNVSTQPGGGDAISQSAYS